jgi:hypothetical protein
MHPKWIAAEINREQRVCKFKVLRNSEQFSNLVVFITGLCEENNIACSGSGTGGKRAEGTLLIASRLSIIRIIHIF